MKKLSYHNAKTHYNQILIEFEIPYFSEIQKIEWISQSEYDYGIFRALVLEDDDCKIPNFTIKTKIEKYQTVGINQELNEGFQYLCVVSRTDYFGKKLEDIYLFRKSE